MRLNATKPADARLGECLQQVGPPIREGASVGIIESAKGGISEKRVDARIGVIGNAAIDVEILRVLLHQRCSTVETIKRHIEKRHQLALPAEGGKIGEHVECRPIAKLRMRLPMVDDQENICTFADCKARGQKDCVKAERFAAIEMVRPFGQRTTQQCVKIIDRRT